MMKYMLYATNIKTEQVELVEVYDTEEEAINALDNGDIGYNAEDWEFYGEYEEIGTEEYLYYPEDFDY